MEKKASFEILREQFNIPDFITVRDAAEILEIAPESVRILCAAGKLIAHQTIDGSGNWRIDTEQFMDKPNWSTFLEKRERIKKQSKNIANKMLEFLDDVE